MLPIKWKLPYAFLVMLFMLSGCGDRIVYVDVAPQLEIIVYDQSEDTVPGALVSLYTTQEYWAADTNAVASLQTNNSGSALFTDLEEIRYYFLVVKDEKNNLGEISEILDPLKVNVKAIVETTIK